MFSNRNVIVLYRIFRATSGQIKQGQPQKGLICSKKGWWNGPRLPRRTMSPCLKMGERTMPTWRKVCAETCCVEELAAVAKVRATIDISARLRTQGWSCGWVMCRVWRPSTSKAIWIFKTPLVFVAVAWGRHCLVGFEGDIKRDVQWDAAARAVGWLVETCKWRMSTASDVVVLVGDGGVSSWDTCPECWLDDVEG